MSGRETSFGKNIHAGHRARLRQTYLTSGMDALTDIQVLELLLFYAIPQRDTNPIAHRLLDAFGGLAGVLKATPEELQVQGGLSENASALLTLVMDLSRRQQICLASMERILRTSRECGDYLLPFFENASDETVYVLALDAKCKALGCKKLFSGSVSATSLSVRSVVAYALQVGASSIVLAHNHPSGIAVPSREDIQTTQTLAGALYAVDVLLADHLVVAGRDYVSMRDSGYLKLPGTP